MVACALMLVAVEARSDVFPIVDGYLWKYAVEDWFPGTEHYSAVFDGTAEINGQPTHVLRYSGGPYDGLVSYWSQDLSGDVYWHGVGSEVFDPPILHLDIPLSLGRVWSTTVHRASGPVTYRSQVVTVGPITVPAGTFDCFSVARFSDGIFYAIESFADDVGPVEMAWHDPYRLEQLTAPPGLVPVVQSTWSTVRRLYR